MRVDEKEKKEKETKGGEKIRKLREFFSMLIPKIKRTKARQSLFQRLCSTLEQARRKFKYLKTFVLPSPAELTGAT